MNKIKLPPLPAYFDDFMDRTKAEIQDYANAAIEAYRNEREGCENHITRQANQITGETSDGYHTFNELYAHRVRLFCLLMHAHKGSAWWSRKHHDGSAWEGWVITGIDTPEGSITYHLPESEIENLPESIELSNGKEWDGHTSDDVLVRLLSLRQVRGEPVAESIEKLAINRYRPVPAGLLAYKVVAGDGSRSLFSGTKDECKIVAAKLTEAFLDGAHVAPQPQQTQKCWKGAVDHELVTIGSTADSFASPKEAIQALIDWHVSVAIDPLVNGGYALVPIEPTIEMINAGWADDEISLRQRWKAMLEAAPQTTTEKL